MVDFGEGSFDEDVDFFDGHGVEVFFVFAFATLGLYVFGVVGGGFSGGGLRLEVHFYEGLVGGGDLGGSPLVDETLL